MEASHNLSKSELENIQHKGLTAAQSTVYQAILELAGKLGHVPGFKRIGEACGYTSLATVHRHVHKLIAKGFLAQDPISGAISLENCCPLCGARRAA